MKFQHSAAVAAFFILPGAAMAQGFTGAELSADMLAYADAQDLGETNYSAGIEFGVFSGFGFAADYSYHNWRGRDGNSSAITLHGLYEVSPTATAGIFFGQDRRNRGDTDFYGIEGAAEVSGVSVEGFIGRFDGIVGDGTMVGVDAGFAFTPQIAATASAGVLNGNTDLNRFSIGGEYNFASGPTVFAEIGKLGLGDSEDQTFISLGGRIALGQGTTFGPRGLTDLIPTY